jgi:hypothetical protein
MPLLAFCLLLVYTISYRKSNVKVIDIDDDSGG